MDDLPEHFIRRLKDIAGQKYFKVIIDSFSCAKSSTYRINTLKSEVRDVKIELNNRRVSFREIDWCREAIIIMDRDSKAVDDLIDKGILYKQSLSSQWVVLCLNLAGEVSVLDLCAAPGSKTSHIAARMNGGGKILAVEAVRKRMYRLKSVLDLLGVKNTTILLSDARKIKPERQGYDRVLVDAPCSSEGRFRVGEKKSTLYWSERKIREMAQKQKGILKNAGRLVAPGGILVYSTCTFATEENEAVIDWFLRKSEHSFEVQKIEAEDIPVYPVLRQCKGKILSKEITKCIRILPTPDYDAFFVAKLKRVL